MPVLLADGTPVSLRPATQGDRRHLERGFERLSHESRFQRFFSPVPALSPAALEYLTSIDGVDHCAVIALAAEAGEEVGIGVARYVRSRDDHEAAEVAVTVIDDYQGRGVGPLLLGALGEEARRHGITRFEGTVLVENPAMQAVLRRAGATFRRDTDPTVLRFDLDLVAPGGSVAGQAASAAHA